MLGDAGQVGTISLILRRCQIGVQAEDQTNRSAAPGAAEPQSLPNVEPEEDHLDHFAG